MSKQQPDYWQNCYNSGWGDLLIPAAYSHPAKMARSLVFKIVAHALEEGWIQPGQWILDPFAGVGTTALPTLMAGLNYVGVELESRFVELGRQNIALWNSRFSGMPRWTGEAILLQGDSRRLAEVVNGAGLVVSSPPYAESLHINESPEKELERMKKRGLDSAIGKASRNGEFVSDSNKGYGSTPGQLATLPPGDIQAVISSPSFAGNTGGRGDASRNGIDAALFDRHSGGMKKGTGSDPANLDHLKMGTPPIAIVSSPPYADGCAHTGGDDPHPEHIEGGKNGVYGVDSYGSADGQLGGMKVHPEPSRRAGVAVVGSPPFENGSPHNGGAAAFIDDKRLFGDYGSTAGQIGATQGQTFWEAAALIVGQCYEILPPNAYAIWVVKNYVKSGREVDFTGQWQALCEACGFETVHEHRAMLVKKNGAQAGFDGGMVSKDVSRKSFFRRLHERRRPDLAIDWETVLCTRKPA